jgi:putative methanogenesis marker protein 8
MVVIKKNTHITKSAGSKVTVKNGKVINIEEPRVKWCPLHKYLYKKNIIHTKDFIKKHIEMKIKKVGMFTKDRIVETNNDLVPYGASEILMNAKKDKLIECAVLACDGAGTVIASKPELIQGIGEWMGGLVKTSPIKEVIDKIKIAGGIILNQKNAEINQLKGVKKAYKTGYKKIAVTISGYNADILLKLKNIEKKYDISLTTLIVCNTGISDKNAHIILKYADLVWACASKAVWDIIAPKAKAQLGISIPVFILTDNGKKIIKSHIKNIKHNIMVSFFTKNLPIKFEKKCPRPLV